MQRGVLVLFTLILIGAGVFGASYFYRLQRAEALVDQAVIELQDGRYADARKTLSGAVAQYDYGIVAGPSLYLIADSYVKEQKYQKATEALKTLLADRRIGLTDGWSVQSVVTLSKLYRWGHHPLSESQKDVLEYTLEKIARGLEQERTAERTELQREIDALGERIRTASFSPLVPQPTREQLHRETRTELGFLYLEDGKYTRAEEILTSLGTPVGRLGLAQLYVERGEEARGIDILQELLDYDRTGGVRALYLREATEYGITLFRQKRYDEGLKVFGVVGRQADSLPYADVSLYYVALYWYGAKRYDRALRAIDAILDNGTPFKDEDALLLKGFLHYDTRDFPRALKTFDSFIRKYPGSPQVRKAREWKAMSERSIKYLG
jgi:tetratricopeptide (TPR) repeat protein